MTNIYRGYEIREGKGGYWIYKGKDEPPCRDTPCTSEDAACDEIDRWKREQANAKREGGGVR